MPRIIAAIAVSLLAGFALGAWLLGDASLTEKESATSLATAATESSTPIEERLRRLEQIVADERDARIVLEGELLALVDELERIGASGQWSRGDERASAQDRRETSDAAARRRAPRDFASMLQSFQQRRLTMLIDGGFSEDEARRIMSLESEARYKAMQAAHDAQRRGEANDSSLASNSAQSLLRDELGDAEYERYLTAQGEPAAIRITQVLDSSPARQAGLQPGDEIVRYSGERVFSVSDLRALTLQGTAGEDVIVEIDRDGVRMQLNLPRGPVGITGSSANLRNRGWWGGT